MPAAPVSVRRGWRTADLLAPTLTLLAVGNLGRPALLRAPEIPILLNDVLVIGVLTAGALACVRARSFRVDAVALIAGVFALVGFAAALASADRYNLPASEVVSGLSYLVRWGAYFGVYLVVLNTIHPDDAPRLFAAFERGVLAFAAFGIFQAVFIPGFAQKIYPSGGSYTVWDVQGNRLVSSLLDPNFAGAFILLALFVQIAKISYGEPIKFWKPIMLLAAALLTVSRSTMLALAVGVSVIVAARGLNRRLLRGVALVVVAAAPFVPALVSFARSFNKFQVDDSALQRLIAWRRALTVFTDNPVFGVGFNLYGAVGHAYGWEREGVNTQSLDGGLLFVAVLTGIVGVLLYALLLTLNVRRCRQVWRDGAAAPAVRGTALGVAAGTVALTVHSLFVNTLLSPFLMEPLWALWGAVFLYAHAPGGARVFRAPVVAANGVSLPGWRVVPDVTPADGGSVA